MKMLLILVAMAIFSFAETDFFPLNSGNWWKYDLRFKADLYEGYPGSAIYYSELHFGEYYRVVDTVRNDTAFTTNYFRGDSAYITYKGQAIPDTSRHVNDSEYIWDTKSIFYIDSNEIQCISGDIKYGDLHIIKTNLSIGDIFPIPGYSYSINIIESDSAQIQNNKVEILTGRCSIDQSVIFSYANNIGMVRCSTNTGALDVVMDTHVLKYYGLKLVSTNLLSGDMIEKKDGFYTFENCINIFPNPFNPSTSISYNLGPERTGTFQIFDIRGKQVFSRPIQGSGTVIWDAGGLGSGVYVLKVLSAGRTYSRKLVLQR